MPIRRALFPRFKWSQVTSRELYLNRRAFMLAAAAATVVGGERADAAPPIPAGAPLKATRNPTFALADSPTKFQDATPYNNFYESGVNKDDPARLAQTLKPPPWAVEA